MPTVQVQCPRCRFEFEGEPKPGAFCPRCGELVKVVPGERPVALTPAGQPSPAASRWKLTAGASFLGLATLLGLFMSVASLAIDEIAHDQARQASGFVDMRGRVTDGELEPLALVNVTALGANATTTTDQEGRWNLTLEADAYRLRFEKPGYRSLEYRVYAVDYPVAIEIPVELREGSGVDHGEMFPRGWRIGFAVFFALAAFATLAATVATARRTNWALAVIGSIIGVLSGWTILGAIASLIALVLVASSRREFRS